MSSKKSKNLRFIAQHDQMDCGPACLAMVASYYGKKYDLNFFRDNTFITRHGVSLSGISHAAQEIGFETLTVKLTTERLKTMPLPCIAHWNQNHFVVLYKVNKHFNFLPFREAKWVFKVADPGHGFISLPQEKIEKSWITEEGKGIALFLEPTEKFYALTPPKTISLSFKYLLNYLSPFKKQLSLMFLLLLLGSVLNLFFPFLTQILIDKGIHNKNIKLITLILFAQLGLFLGTITIEIFRNWITLYVGTKISIKIISDFLKKMINLPIRFFDSKMVGDLNQRIQDNERIENFITSQSILTFFSIVTFLVFFGVLFYYDFKILVVYLLFTILAIYWSFYWLKKRREIDYSKFQQQSQNQSSIYEIISGVAEMKLNQLEDFKRKEWENIQKKLFKINLRILKIDQFQVSGFEFLNQLKNILVTFLAAYYVVENKMTLGELLSVSYIIGQMNSPVNQLVNFFRSLQDAKLSLERLNEVQNHPTEENENKKQLSLQPLPLERAGVRFNNVSFQYEGPKSPFVLKDINLFIPDGKITAIVGGSGSGKTTLIKLLLKFYEPTQGNIFFNENNINDLSPKNLRKNCGVVMQDSFIFSDTIERNIATGDKNINLELIENAVKISNINDFIKTLPLKYKTKIGASGSGISGGEKQRILIARAVYKNPHYIFFDEATSALDAENERVIHDNLQNFYKGKTVVIIAHRLSTVKNADQIIVLKKGKIVEQGNHKLLIQNKNHYYNLVKNQLELGS